MSCSLRHKCEGCGDNLIHQRNRGPHESASAFGQHIHDSFPNVFWLMDIDCSIYKKATRIFRVCENKELNGELKPSQKFILPLLAIGIWVLVAVGFLHKESGCFLIRSQPPFEMAEVRKILPDMKFRFGDAMIMENHGFELFKTGEIVGYADRLESLVS